VGVGGRLFQAISSLNKDVKCCILLNGFDTPWFDVECGLKQGCPLSPMLFNLYINNLDKGVYIGERKICILLYADDRKRQRSSIHVRCFSYMVLSK
jgi:hypothetical protein